MDITTDEGLHHKYDVTNRETGEDVRGAFVLRPDRDRAAVTALGVYAAAVAEAQPTLAADLRHLVKRLSTSDTTRRGFYHLGEAWYSPFTTLDHGAVDDVYLGFFDEHGATVGELKLTWYIIGDSHVPRLESFCDSWRALFGMQDVLAALAERDGQNVTPAEFCDMLKWLGFEDLTE